MDDETNPFADLVPSDDTSGGTAVATAPENPFSDLIPRQATDEISPDNPFKDLIGKNSDTPATDSALKQSREAQRPKVDWSHPVMQGVKDVIEGTLQGAVQLPEQMYKVARAGFDKGTLGTATELANQAIPMGAQIAKDVQSPVGSREWTRGVLQMGMMATPGLEIARELRPIGKPPIQPEAFQLPPSPTLGPGTTAADVTKALQGQGWERRFQMVPEPKAQVEPAPDLETVLSGLPEGRFGTETPEGFVPQARTGVVPPSETARIGDQNASTITSAEGVSEPEVRTQVGEEAPLRQQGETAGAQEPVSTGESVATEVQAEPDGGGVGTVEHRVQHGEHAEEGYTAIDTPEEDVGISQAKTEAELPESGISTERLQEIYGDDAVIINKGKSPQQWKAIGQADKRDPYEVLTQARRRGIAPPADAPLLRAEHQRLLERARQAYGTPAYPQLAQYAADFANATKQVVHGPASELMRGLQEADVPRYDSPADFDSIIRERMQRESTPQEQETFSKVADELKNGDAEVKKTAADAQTRLKRYSPKEEISFDDAVDHVRKQIKELTEPCAL